MAQRKFLIDGGFEVNAASEINADLTMSGHIIPTVDSDGITGYDLGTPTAKWRDLYLSKGSLYIDGQKVLESDSGTIVVQADPDQSLLTKTSGAGVLTFASPNPIAIAATLQMGAGKRITDAGADAVTFGDKVDMDGNRVINMGAPINDFDGATKKYVDDAFDDVLGGAPAALDTLNELANALGDDANYAATITTALTEKADKTYVDSQVAQAVINANSNSSASTDALDLRVTANEGLLATHTAQIAANSAAMASNATDIASNSIAITAAISTASADATVKANAAQANAQAYTDGRETAITTAYRAYTDAAIDASNEISEMEDVSLGSLTNNQALTYNASAGVWTNSSLTTATIAEAPGGLYYTDVRVRDVLSADNIADTTDVATAKSEAVAYTDDRETAITTAYINAISTEATARANADSTLQNNIDSEESARIAADATLQSNINTEKGRIDAILSASTADKDTFAEIVTFINSVDTANDSALGTEITTRAAADTALQDNIDAEASARASADTALATDLTNKIGDATVDGTANNTITDRIASAQSAAEATASADATSKANAAQSAAEATASADATSKANAAQAAATSAANAYTDGRETAITTAYQSYADTAEADAVSTAAADATSKANTAEANAKAYTDTRESAITTAYQSADTAAATDLTNKIGDATVNGTSGNTVTDRIATAKSEAISAASTDASTKAGEAQTAATTAANSYTDGRETSIRDDFAAADTTLQNNINVEKGRIDAILNAADADKDTFAEIVTFINSVDTTNDTALGTEITTRAAADSALSGRLDTLEGSGAGSVANALVDAKAYADQAEADAVSTASADATSKANAAQSAAEATASADATSKANAAQSAAEATASADATSKVSAEASTRAAADSALDTAKAEKSVSMGAGNGLTGGGTLASNRTFNVGQGTGITVSADAVAVDVAWADNRYLQSVTHVHGSPVVISSSESDQNNDTTGQSGGSAAQAINVNLGQTGLVHYQVFLNRQLLRPTEVTNYDSSTGVVTIAASIVATDDELEIVGFKVS
jgi:hypothetical protein